ncbi:putative apyrase 7 [Morella rubra]|uniref:Putative apyrase 7 n=1 Tax=Morella rubra TaxID=262757 RepID=A0A6A1UKJ4_9ROSI|nr:putative apyrase 7 [Morella rubra]
MGSYFTVVVDCGSTGTRVNVYEWMTGSASSMNFPLLLHSYPDNTTKSSLWKNSCQYHCMQTEPGLDKFCGNSSGVRASLEPLIAWAEQVVPHERHGDTPIFVLGTAGLRKLAIENARRVLEDVEAVVKEHTFLYRKSWIRVLSGKEEAYYGWVALNYKMGSFRNHSRSPTLGLIDLGGSSLQVVMEIEEARQGADMVISKIGSILMKHQILAYSLPAFGLNEAFDRSIVMLSQAQRFRETTGKTLEVRHPCLGSDVAQNYTCSGCRRLNATNQEILSSQPLKAVFPSLYLVGDPNWERCKELAKAAAIKSRSLDWSQPAVGTNCKASSSSYSGSDTINSTAVAHPLHARLSCFMDFFAVYSMLNLSPRANLTKLLEEGQQLCSRSWANSSRISRTPNYGGQYCFWVPYMASLIEDALCLGDKEIIFGPGDVSWTLGAALVEDEKLFSRTTQAHTSISIFKNMEIMSSPVLLFVLLLCLLFILYWTKIKLPLPSKKVAATGESLPSYGQAKHRPN